MPPPHFLLVNQPFGAFFSASSRSGGTFLLLSFSLALIVLLFAVNSGFRRLKSSLTSFCAFTNVFCCFFYLLFRRAKQWHSWKKNTYDSPQTDYKFRFTKTALCAHATVSPTFGSVDVSHCCFCDTYINSLSACATLFLFRSSAAAALTNWPSLRCKCVATSAPTTLYNSRLPWLALLLLLLLLLQSFRQCCCCCLLLCCSDSFSEFVVVFAFSHFSHSYYQSSVRQLSAAPPACGHHSSHKKRAVCVVIESFAVLFSFGLSFLFFDYEKQLLRLNEGEHRFSQVLVVGVGVWAYGMCLVLWDFLWLLGSSKLCVVMRGGQT